MNDTNKTLKESNYNKKQKSWALEYAMKVKIQNEKINEIFSNTNYIKWLEYFTRENPNFTDDDWIYNPNKISKEDLENVSKLCLIYQGIAKYAKENYIHSNPCDFGDFYQIKLDNIGFKIGTLLGQGNLFFCTRMVIENENNFIDFYDIMYHKTNTNTTIINNKLTELSNLIISLYESGIPIEEITKTVSNSLNRINLNNKVKVLKRK